MAGTMNNLTRGIFDGAAWIAVARFNYMCEFYGGPYRERVMELRNGTYIGAPWAGLHNLPYDPPLKRGRKRKRALSA